MRRGVRVLLVCLLGASAATTAQEHTITAVATVKQLCEGVITASSDAVFNVGREAPSSDDEWHAMRNHVIMLAESGNLPNKRLRRSR